MSSQPMRYIVFSQSPSLEIFKLGETFYIEDARQILNNWHSGFINSASGYTVVEKNLIKKELEDDRTED